MIYRRVISGGRCGVGSGSAVENANIPLSCRRSYTVGVVFPEDGRLGISNATALACFRRAAEHISQKVDCRFDVVTDGRAAHCHVTFGFLSGGVLAWSDLADNTCHGGKRQKYDIRRWDSNSLFLTICHEFGHLLGLHHSVGDDRIMNPSINLRLDGWQPADVRQAVGLGYVARDGEGPVGFLEVLLRLLGNEDFVRLIISLLQLIGGKKETAALMARLSDELAKEISSESGSGSVDGGGGRA
jgi:hypothetical protein